MPSRDFASGSRYAAEPGPRYAAEHGIPDRHGSQQPSRTTSGAALGANALQTLLDRMDDLEHGALLLPPPPLSIFLLSVLLDSSAYLVLSLRF